MERNGLKDSTSETVREEGAERDCLLQTDRLMDIHFIFIDRFQKSKSTGQFGNMNGNVGCSLCDSTETIFFDLLTRPLP